MAPNLLITVDNCIFQYERIPIQDKCDAMGQKFSTKITNQSKQLLNVELFLETGS